jgi:2-amino-4-hydroxy-6-hydroxymethyldihydropteridine diphosphokinase
VTAAYVGIGSNLDDPHAQVTRAFDALAQLPRTRLSARSSLYRSAPLGYAAQPDFVNAVAALDTELGAEELLRELQAIEAQHARQRSFANAPRTLDLDLLLYGDAKIDSPALIVPHPRMHERAFVLHPLLEIAPAAEIPGRGPASRYLAACAKQKVEKLA